ncbi:MAG: cupin, partial [Planctomycetia bacterium]|nr:cupin [Planctomycetia bacterium]
MTKLIEQTARFPQDDIEIDEYFGRISSGDDRLSWCRIRCVAGWSEPYQRPDFDEYMVVLRGCLHIRHEGAPTTMVRAGQAAIVAQG